MIYVTDPEDCTRFDRTDSELEEWAIFCTCVAGKNARTIHKCLKKFWLRALVDIDEGWMSPFDVICRLTKHREGRWNWIAGRLKNAGIGCHTLKAKAIMRLAYHWEGRFLRFYSVDNLQEMVPGWGPKTVRYFVLHSRENQRCIPLDTHVLKYLRDRGVPNVPDSTPPAGKRYQTLEKQFLFFYDTSAKKKYSTVAEFDLALWNLYSKRKGA